MVRDEHQGLFWGDWMGRRMNHYLFGTQKFSGQVWGVWLGCTRHSKGFGLIRFEVQGGRGFTSFTLFMVQELWGSGGLRFTRCSKRRRISTW